MITRKEIDLAAPLTTPQIEMLTALAAAPSTAEAKDLFDIKYSEGYANAAQKITKPTGESIYVVPLETEDAVYMVKVDVVVDSKFTEEEFDKEILGSTKNDEEIAEESDEEAAGEQGKEKFVLIHGDYSEVDETEEPKEDLE